MRYLLVVEKGIALIQAQASPLSCCIHKSKRFAQLQGICTTLIELNKPCKLFLLTYVEIEI
jgi:hypothetical protein